MPHCCKHKGGTKTDKSSNNNDVNVRNDLTAGPSSHQNTVPKLRKCRYFNLDRPGCSMDDCIPPYPATIYLPDGEGRLPKTMRMFEIDDGVPPPNCNPFEAGTEFACSAVPGFVGKNVSADLASLQLGTDNKSKQGLLWFEKSVAAADRAFDCRKLANGCFTQHVQLPRCRFRPKEEKTPNLVVYVPRCRIAFACHKACCSKVVPKDVCHEKRKEAEHLERIAETENSAEKQHKTSSASTSIVDEHTHSTVLSLDLSDPHA